VGSFTLARSLRIALLGLTVVLAAVAAGGVAYLYSSRQDYEDRIAQAYGLQASASRLLAAGVVEEATVRAARGEANAAQRRRARLAFEAAVREARTLADGDPDSLADIGEVVRAQARLRADPDRVGAPLAARASIVRLATAQRAELADARRDAKADSRRAVIAAAIGGALALIAALGLVAAMVAAIRRPLDALVAAAERLAAGDLGVRVDEDGPAELRALALAFNRMAADLERARERIAAEGRRTQTTIESLGDGLLIAGDDGRVERRNPRAEELVPSLAPGVAIADARILPPLDEALGAERTVEHEGRSLFVTAACLTEGGGAVWTIRDATERVRLERLKSEFVATASHELRSPLTSIKGFIELIAHGSDALTDRQREFIEIVQRSTDRLVDLVNDLLDVARVEAGRVEIHRRPTALPEIAREVAALLRPRLDDKAQRLELDAPANLPLALADPARVRQILTNLVTNAHLYTDAGGRIRIVLGETPLHLTIEVSDDGRGMSEEDVEHAFDRFYRGKGDGQPGGTGLGLAIVRSLVELHGGDIELTSALGEGTTFTIRLPRSPTGDDGVAAPRHALRGRRVLVVDDEREIADLIAARLEPWDVETVVVTSGAEALERLRAERFDAITLDILMPGMSGFEVLRTLRADPELRGIPVVVVSVFSGREALAGEWVVPKPIDADELVDALGQAVLAGRVRVLVVARAALRETLAPTLTELGIEHEWVADGAAAAAVCQARWFEVALVDAGLSDTGAALRGLDLRGRRLRRSVVVFSGGDEDSPGLARLDAEPVAIEDAGATVLGLLQTEPPSE